MLDFFNRNAGAIQAVGAILTVVLALAALVGVKLQIDAADQIQRSQSARDIYREFLNLSVANPRFSQPDHCALAKGSDFGAYESYVGYLLYSAEQVLAVDPEWDAVLRDDLVPHAALICDMDAKDVEMHTPAVQGLITDMKQSTCQQVKPCG